MAAELVTYQKAREDIGAMRGFFKGRKALPHFIERRISLKMHLKTAP